jgi:hypothetical protein
MARTRLAGLTIAAVLFFGAAGGGSAQAQSYWGSGNSAPVTGDCDAGVQQHEDQMARSVADAYTALGQSAYQVMPSGGYSSASCLSNLLNGNLDIIFNPPSLSEVLASLVNGVCNYVTTLATGEVESVVGAGASEALPSGEIYPGVNLGSDLGGISLSPQYGGTTSGINVNGQSPQSGNLAGYWGGSQESGDYGSLFGAGQSKATGGGGWFSNALGNL